MFFTFRDTNEYRRRKEKFHSALYTSYVKLLLLHNFQSDRSLGQVTLVIRLSRHRRATRFHPRFQESNRGNWPFRLRNNRNAPRFAVRELFRRTQRHFYGLCCLWPRHATTFVSEARQRVRNKVKNGSMRIFHFNSLTKNSRLRDLISLSL